MSLCVGYWYGKSLIPVSDADEKAMVFQAPRCLSLLGFSKKSSIKNHQTLGNGVQVVVANPDDKVIQGELCCVVSECQLEELLGFSKL